MGRNVQNLLAQQVSLTSLQREGLSCTNGSTHRYFWQLDAPLFGPSHFGLASRQLRIVPTEFVFVHKSNTYMQKTQQHNTTMCRNPLPCIVKLQLLVKIEQHQCFCLLQNGVHTHTLEFQAYMQLLTNLVPKFVLATYTMSDEMMQTIRPTLCLQPSLLASTCNVCYTPTS